MTDIVTPLGKAYDLNNTNNMLADYGELRYCLRSIEKHLKNVGNIYFLGMNMPDWITGVYQVRVDDKEGKEYKEWNIYNKVLVASKLKEISNDFLFMNDDHYLLTDFDADMFPFFYEGMIKDYYHPKLVAHQITKRNTATILGEDIKYFDVHCPIRYNKTLYEKVTKVKWTTDYGYLLKTLYCNYNNIEGDSCIDLKINSVVSEHWLSIFMPEKVFFSTSDNCWDEGGALIRMMDELYPKKSRWEK